MGIREFLSGISKFFEGPLIRLTITSWTARKRGSTLGLEREVELLDLFIPRLLPLACRRRADGAYGPVCSVVCHSTFSNTKTEVDYRKPIGRYIFDRAFLAEGWMLYKPAKNISFSMPNGFYEL